MKVNTIIQHDVTKDFPLPDSCIDVVITSPPYWGLRDYGVDGQIGLEKHPQEYIDKLVGVAREIKRVLKKSGSFYLNLGDTYFGGHSGGVHSEKSTFRKSKNDKMLTAQDYQRRHISDGSNWLQPKQLMLIPSRVAIALQDDGWILRNTIIWHKPNPMPSSVKDRLNNTFEYVFHFVKNRRYYYDLNAIREPHKIESIERAARRDLTQHTQYRIQSNRNGEHGRCHELGKNPGDVVDAKYKGQDVNPSEGHIRRGKELHDAYPPGYNGHPMGKNPGDFWDITTQPFTSYSRDLEHFAVFPKELIIKPLKASCPTQICKKCGKPRYRITKNHTTYESGSGRSGKKPKGKYKDKEGTGIIGKNLRMGPTPNVETIGWSDCGCNASFTSGVVLDPFCGRGTVGRVAKELGLNYVLFDINPDYCELARLYVNGQKRKLIKNQGRLET